LDVHVELYTNILCMVWFLHKFKNFKCILSRYRFQIREHNWWWNLAFETISYGIS
jgi:hypothetical protein